MPTSLYNSRSRENIFKSYRRKLRRLFRLTKRYRTRFNIGLTLLFLLLFVALTRWLFYAPTAQPDFNVDPSISDSFQEGYAFKNLTNQQPALVLEKQLAFKHVCHRKTAHEDVQYFHLCGQFSSNHDGKKIVALVEVRNVEPVIDIFLMALRQIVDSVVVIDDHSTDGSRNRMLSFNNRITQTDRRAKPLIEVILNKTGTWVREELLDRQLLLSAGREIGGTHFILLDYDEFISSNCVEDGTIRRQILQLAPGESLFIPWVEAWKSLSRQRVIPNDPNMNFLKRRQTVIFADDGKVTYTIESSLARQLGSTNTDRNGTIHVVRCPRSMCPQPSPYRGPGTGQHISSRVKTLSQCRIVELRFLNLNNIFLKSAWYEALGRVTGAEDGSTSGKMITSLFGKSSSDHSDNPTTNQYFPHPDSVATAPLDPKWLESYEGVKQGIFEKVELWRAKELLEWIQEQGRSQFTNLSVLDQLDVDGLRDTFDTVEKEQNQPILLVPREKVGTLIFAVDDISAPVLRDFLLTMGWDESSLGSSLSTSFPGPEEDVKYEARREAIETAFQTILQQSPTKSAFLSMTHLSAEVSADLLRFCNKELPYIRVLVLFSSSDPDQSFKDLYSLAVSFSLLPGSNMHTINIPFQQFGSFSVVTWLSKRLSHLCINKTISEQDYSTLLAYTKKVHSKYEKHMSSIGKPLSPIAHLIFSLNVGRSGSKYLADILASAKGALKATHEPRCPEGTCSGGGAMRMQNRSLADSYHERQSVKLSMIRSELLSIGTESKASDIVSSSLHDCKNDETFFPTDLSVDTDKKSANSRDMVILETHFANGARCTKHIPNHVTYAETNPNFKSWEYDVVLDSLPQLGYDISVIVLRKYIAATLKSLYETGYFTTRDGYNWMETSAGINSKVKIHSLQNDQVLNAQDRILSYLLNAEMVFQEIENGYNKTNISFIKLRSEYLYTKQGTIWLMRKLGIRSTSLTMKLAGRKRDKYQSGKKHRYGHIPLELCENWVKEFRQKVTKEAPNLDGVFDGLDKIAMFDYPK